ncbi:MAG: hypothetical protein WC957_03720 [Candidatus Neomarinimicrobiota bacterium]|jgi:hypothetical protein
MPQQKQSVSLPSFIRTRPPYTTPIRWPKEIIADYLDYQEQQAWIGFIQMKQKTNGEWEDIRKKMPPELLEKTARVLSDCRRNGFINPKVFNGKLYWYQIMGSERNRNHNCECDLCDRNMTSGTCMGKFINNRLGHRDFKKCWEK